MGDHGDRLAMVVLGLGNPGEEFAATRHNVGADVVRLLAQLHGDARFKQEKSNRALVATVRLGESRAVLAIPTTYMNESGSAARPLLKHYGAGRIERLVAWRIQWRLPVGSVKLKAGGGTAGHNGLKSVQAHLHSAEFVRVRVGIGKPTSARSGADYVLARPTRSERELIDVAMRDAADAVELTCEQGLNVAMNRFNGER
ncbi:MAG: aminoacyl-tRNA hydrolase [Actinobacteria bacterium]|nr:aminoacyl-tRNA hydrolase [Actinomycetota bacterium]